jgi:hypothetical protein
MMGDAMYVLLLGAVLLAVVSLATARPHRRPRRHRRVVPELYEAAAPTDATKLAALAGSPLAPALARAVDSPLPPSFVDHPDTTMPYDREEVRQVMSLVVARINHHAPGLGVHLISVDGVRKHGDAAGTMRYWADITVYSKARNVSAKVSVVAEVRQQNGHVAVRRLVVHGTTASDDAGLQAAHEVDEYAAYEPALVYVPETGSLEGSLLG